ncbi:MAG: acetylglutamate kinase, partial [Rhodospirillaceae bacterium]
MPIKPGTDPDKLAEVGRTLAEALPYMRQFNGQTFVVKFGGHAMGDDDLAISFAQDIVMLRQVG